ncbi:hypothetical protein C8J57DRAFT_1227228 [Mycena rebaudengoi]|nr:hypothetical protein C8J57DRAFT_1227228 [Mycena rebaudengoi]
MSTQVPRDASHFVWDVPNVVVPVPQSRDAIPFEIPALSSLGFDPISLFNLHRSLGAGTPGFDHFHNRYNSADMAWLALDASEDGHHIVGPDVFFPEYLHLQESQPGGVAGQEARKEFADSARRLICDVATKYDCCTAGTTFIIHVNDTTVPNVPVAPEQIKAQVYPPPPHLLLEHPEIKPTVAFIVQSVIEHISIPTIADWRHKAQRKWNLTQQAHVFTVPPPTFLIPPPLNLRSAQYIFPGRPWGSLTLPTSIAGPYLTGLAPVNPDDLSLFDIEELMREHQQLAFLEAENTELCSAVEVLQTLTASMQGDLHDRAAELGAMSAKILRLEADLSTARAAPMMWETHLTDQYLEDHGLRVLEAAVMLIMCCVSLVDWREELNSLESLPNKLVDGLVNAMAYDRNI